MLRAVRVQYRRKNVCRLPFVRRLLHTLYRHRYLLYLYIQYGCCTRILSMFLEPSNHLRVVLKCPFLADRIRSRTYSHPSHHRVSYSPRQLATVPHLPVPSSFFPSHLSIPAATATAPPSPLTITCHRHLSPSPSPATVTCHSYLPHLQHK